MISRRWIPPLFFLLVAIAFVTACINHNDESDARPGNVQFVLTAAPAMATSSNTGGTNALASAVPMHDDDDDDDGEGDDILSRLSQVNVTFSSLLARNLDGELVSLVIDLPLTVDLISVLNGNEVTFPSGTLPPGMYDQIVVVIKKVEFVFVDGLSKALTPPGGGWTRIIPVETFEVIDGQTITIELRFRPLHAFEELNGEFEFSPDFECRRRD